MKTLTITNVKGDSHVEHNITTVFVRDGVLTWKQQNRPRVECNLVLTPGVYFEVDSGPDDAVQRPIPRDAVDRLAGP